MLDARGKLRVLGLFEVAPGGIGTYRGRRLRLQDQSQLPPHLRAGPHRRGLSGWRLVSFLHAASNRADHSGASDRRATRARISVRDASLIDLSPMLKSDS